MPKGWQRDVCFICKAGGVNWVSKLQAQMSRHTAGWKLNVVWCCSFVEGYDLDSTSIQITPEKFAPDRLCSCSPGWIPSCLRLMEPELVVLLLDMIEKSEMSLWQVAPFPKSPIAIQTKQHHSRLQHDLGKAPVPSARSAQRTPSQQIMTPRSANNVHREARQLQVPFPTAAAFAMSECCTSRMEGWLFVQLGSLFSATACSQISFSTLLAMPKSARSAVW